MKNTRSFVPAVFVAIVLALTSIASVYSFAQENISVPSKKELKVLLKTAKEPPEHRRIAAYYRQEAARKRAEATEYAKLAAMYGDTHALMPMEPKQVALARGGNHCKRFAALDEKQAQEADALVALHEDMAKAAEKK